MSGGGSSTTQVSDPWVGLQPYLTGTSDKKLKSGVKPIYEDANSGYQYNDSLDNGSFGSISQKLINPESDYETTGTPGIFQNAQNLYDTSKWNSDQSGLADNMFKTLQQRQNQSGNYDTLANDFLSGGFDPAYNSIGYTNAPGAVGSSKLNASTTPNANSITSTGYNNPTISSKGYTAPTISGAQNIGFGSAMGSMGESNPTDALKRLLSGQVDTSTLDPVVNSALRKLGENFTESYMPSLNSGAMAAGGYGGSRHGIAQGLAGKGLANAMGDTSSGMYNNAYNTAQSNMYGTANSLAGIGTDIAKQNAANEMQTQLANQNALANAGQFNSTLDYNTQAQNASNAMRRGEFNSTLDYNTQAQNAQNAMRGNEFNATTLNNMGQYNNDKDLAAQLANASNAMSTNQFNANLGLSNNTQALNNANSRRDNRLQGLNTSNAGNALIDQIYGQQQGLLGQGSAYDWQNINNLSGALGLGEKYGATTGENNPGALQTIGSLGSTAMTAYAMYAL